LIPSPTALTHPNISARLAGSDTWSTTTPCTARLGATQKPAAIWAQPTARTDDVRAHTAVSPDKASAMHAIRPERVRRPEDPGRPRPPCHGPDREHRFQGARDRRSAKCHGNGDGQQCHRGQRTQEEAVGNREPGDRRPLRTAATTRRFRRVTRPPFRAGPCTDGHRRHCRPLRVLPPESDGERRGAGAGRDPKQRQRRGRVRRGCDAESYRRTADEDQFLVRCLPRQRPVGFHLVARESGDR
jgi:hypothetical protein